MRAKAIHWVVAVVFIFLFFSLVNMQIIQGRKFEELSNKNYIRLTPQEGGRGRIIDCNGDIIVDNRLAYDVVLMPQSGEDIDKILKEAAGVLGANAKELKDNLKNRYPASLGPVTIVRNIGIKKAFALEELKPNLNNFFIQTHPLRYYPYGNLACHAIGYLGEIDRWRLTKLADYGYHTKDMVGFGGVEERYDYYLRQKEGGISFEVDHRGRFMGVLGMRPAQNGKDIQLTLDLKIQKIAEQNLGERKGSVVIMDPYAGEIKAMVSRPGFNPAFFIDKSGNPQHILHAPDSPLINRAITGAYPPGSVFKIIVACAALETRKIDLAKTFFCSGGISIGNQEFSCWNTHSQQDLISAITHSCNVFFYRAGLVLGAQHISDYAARFGLSRITSVDLPYEIGGLLPNPLWKKIYKFQNWFDGDTVNFSIGQGYLLVSPLQIARMMTLFANKTGLASPYIVKAIDGKDTSRSKRRLVNPGFKKTTIDYIRRGLRKAVSEETGTAHILADLPVEVAGKTGTAQIERAQPHGWFVGFFPFNKPKFVICVFLEHGGSGYNASLVTKRIIENMQKEGLIKG